MIAESATLWSNVSFGVLKTGLILELKRTVTDSFDLCDLVQNIAKWRTDKIGKLNLIKLENWTCSKKWKSTKWKLKNAVCFEQINFMPKAYWYNEAHSLCSGRRICYYSVENLNNCSYLRVRYVQEKQNYRTFTYQRSYKIRWTYC